jgi:uncharacterized repeat protein (TIGR01451 family)
MKLLAACGTGRPAQMGLIAALTALAAPFVFAAGTPANTPISNAATLTYFLGGQPVAPITAVAPILYVAELINVVLVWQDATPLAVNSPDINRALTFVLTNTGNGPEAFGLTRNNVIAGDQFDPVNAAGGAIYLESGVQAGFQAGGPNADIPYLTGVNDPVLVADASRVVYVVSDIPGALAIGALGNLSLGASSTTPGAPDAEPGTSLAGLGQGGVDAVVGGSRAQSSAIGGYVVSGISLSLQKTVALVRDPSGGSLVMPGSLLTYRVVLTLTGTGIAMNLSFVDPLPANTTYVPASITVDGAARSDALDADNAGFTAGAVGVVFGNTQAPATRAIEFKVTVN